METVWEKGTVPFIKTVKPPAWDGGQNVPPLPAVRGRTAPVSKVIPGDPGRRPRRLFIPRVTGNVEILVDVSAGEHLSAPVLAGGFLRFLKQIVPEKLVEPRVQTLSSFPLNY
jgi:hypothetical protein